MRRLIFGLIVSVCSCGGAVTGGNPLDGPYADAGPGDTGVSGASGSGSGTSVFIVGSSGQSSTANTGLVTTVATVSGTSMTVVATTSATTTVASSVQTSVPTSTEESSDTSTVVTTPSQTSSSSTSSGPPTWTYLYNTYLAAGSTIGDCDGSCHHHSECDNPMDCYQWIGQGDEGSLTPNGSYALFSWDGGDMPKDGPQDGSEPQADADFEAWIAAGSQDN